MQWKHRKLNSEANWSTSKLNKQQTENHFTIDSTKCKANDKEFANLAEDADFTNVADHAKFAKINAEAHICAKSSLSHKRKCKCKHKCKCRRMKSDYQKTLVKVTKDIISWKKIDSYFEKWELNLTSDENVQCSEQCTEEGKVWHKSHYSD